MSISTTTRQASVDEIAAEMDRRGRAIEQLEARLAHIDGIYRGAIDNLQHHQRQLDQDGIEVAVSRQALWEVLNGVEAALVQPAAQEGWRPTHRHKKRGSEYQLLGIGKMQAEHWVASELPVNVSDSGMRPVDMREVAIYVSKDGDYWVRPREEFEDGRFEVIPAAPSQGSRS